MSLSNIPDIYEAAQGGASQTNAEPVGFHKQLQDIQTLSIPAILPATTDNATVKILPEAADEDLVLVAGENGVLEQFKKIGLPLPQNDTIYWNELKANSEQKLVTGDLLKANKDGSISLTMNDNSQLTFSNGQVTFKAGTSEFTQSSKDGITTIKFANGEVVQYNKDGPLKIWNGQDSVSFKEKRETPAERLDNAVKEASFKLNKEESLALHELAKYLKTGDTTGMQNLARQFHNNPDSLARVVGRMNDALQKAEIPRMSVYYNASVDSLGNRNGNLEVIINHNDTKFSPVTRINVTTSNQGDSVSASYSQWPKDVKQIKPFWAGQSVQGHLANPDSSWEQPRFKEPRLEKKNIQ